LSRSLYPAKEYDTSSTFGCLIARQYPLGNEKNIHSFRHRPDRVFQVVVCLVSSTVVPQNRLPHA
jgi:hypothetical protein